MTRYSLVLAGIVGLSLSSPGLADDWPQWRGPNRDGVWRETGIIDKFGDKQLTADKRIKLAWQQPVSAGYSGPTVAEGRVFVTDRVADPKQIERIHCFEAASGKKLWTHEYERDYVGVGYPAGPRACVTIAEGRAYALGAMGDLHCLAAADGKVLWKKDLFADYEIKIPIWGVSAAPLIEGDLVILHIGGRDACIVALDAKTGEQRWTALSDRASYAAPIIIEQAGKRVLVCWTGDNVAGLDPATGKVHWKHSFPPQKMVIGISTPVVEQDRLFVTSFYDGSLMLKLDPDKLAAEKLWKRVGRSERPGDTDALHSIIATPLAEGDHLYGVDSYGELRCLDAKTGDRLWENKTATATARWSNIHMVRQGERVWMFNEAGELIISRLSPKGYEETSRAKLLDPTTEQLRQRRPGYVGVCWSHPAFASKHVFARNDKEIVCASLAAE
jgi:outer membrane protein assembly factor BamB